MVEPTFRICANKATSMHCTLALTLETSGQLGRSLPILRPGEESPNSAGQCAG